MERTADRHMTSMKEELRIMKQATRASAVAHLVLVRCRRQNITRKLGRADGVRRGAHCGHCVGDYSLCSPFSLAHYSVSLPIIGEERLPAFLGSSLLPSLSGASLPSS